MKPWLHMVGIILFLFILSKIDFLHLTAILSRASVGLVAAALLLHVFIVVIRAYKWRHIMLKQGLHYRLWDCCLMYASGMYLGLVTPGRIGEFGRAWYLKERHSFGASMWSVFADRATDFMMLGLIASLGVWYFGGKIWVLGAFIGLIALGLVLLRMKAWKSIGKRFVSLLLPKRYQRMLSETMNDFMKGGKGLGIVSWSWIFFLTALVWLMYLFQVYLMSLSLGLPLSFAFVGFSVGISGVVSLLPITVLGVGTRDAVLIFLFGLAGLGSESAIALSTLMLLIFIFSAGLGLAAWVRKPLRKL